MESSIFGHYGSKFAYYQAHHNQLHCVFLSLRYCAAEIFSEG